MIKDEREPECLIRGALVWPGPGREPLEGASVLVREGRIARIGRFHARAPVVIEAEGGLLMPGLIQTHVHLCQALFRGVAEELALLAWLRRYLWPLEAAHDEESIRISALLACAEMIRGGTTAFLSFETVRHTAAAMEAVASTGLHGILSHCLMDESGGQDALAVPLDEALADCDAMLQTWRGHPRVGLALAPRFALSCTAGNLREAAAYARDRGLLLHTHASEQKEEVALVRERTGMGNVEYLHALGLSGPDVCLAHCVHTLPRERDLLADTDTRVLHCPSANLKLGSGIAPVPEYLEAGLTVSLGADGAPCNNRMDAFLEMREASLIQKARLGPRALPAGDALRLATVNGARTLRAENEMGLLEEGRRANLILLERRRAHVVPSANVEADLVFAHAASDVALVMVDGRVLLENGELVTIDEERVLVEALRHRRRLLEKAGLA